ncbi:MAG: DUF3566 domain-containing protein [Ilumatobacteraceae bacterium]
MDNAAIPAGQGRGSRAGTKPRPDEAPADGSTANADGGSTGDSEPSNGNGNGRGGNGNGNGRGNRRKRQAAAPGGVVGDPLAGPAVAVTEAAEQATAQQVGSSPDGSSSAAVAPESAHSPGSVQGVSPTVSAVPPGPDGDGSSTLVETEPRADDPGDGGPPFTKGRPFGRFLGRRQKPPVAGADVDADPEAAAAAVSPPGHDLPPGATPLVAIPLVGPPATAPATPVTRPEPVVTRVEPSSTPTAPTRVAPVVVPVVAPTADPSGGLVARKLTAPPGAASLDVPLEPEPTITVPLGRRTGRPSVTFQRRRTRPRVRRVTRVVRHVDTWSVFKVALVFSAFLYAVTLTAGVLLWHVAIATGTIDNVERFFEGFGWESFQFKGGEIFHNAWIAGLFIAVGLTGLAVLLATLFNLITDLVGGVRVSVLEEEVLARRDRTARMVVEDDPDAALPYDQARSG